MQEREQKIQYFINENWFYFTFLFCFVLHLHNRMFIKTFLPRVLILYLLKTSENICFLMFLRVFSLLSNEKLTRLPVFYETLWNIFYHKVRFEFKI